MDGDSSEGDEWEWTMPSEMEVSYYDLFARVRRNDPQTTRAKFDYTTNGYGKSLGEALRGNTHLEHLSLVLFSLVSASDPWTDEQADILRNGGRTSDLEANVSPNRITWPTLRPLLDYVRESSALTSVSLVADAYRQNVQPHAVLLSRFLSAVSQNPNISFLSLPMHVAFSWKGLPSFLHHTKASLKTLELTFFEPFDPLVSNTRAYIQVVVDALGRNITLHSLIVNVTGYIENETRCKTTSVLAPSRSLTVDVASGSFLEALRRNGSLHAVTVLNEDYHSAEVPFWTDQQFRHVQAFCMRNMTLPTLLSEGLLCGGDAFISDGENDDHGGNVAPQNPSTKPFNSQNLVPKLIFVAQQVPWLGPNFILMGLVTSYEPLGSTFM